MLVSVEHQTSTTARPQRGDELELEVQSLAFGGEGVARLGDGGYVVFVSGAIPGDRVPVKPDVGFQSDTLKTMTRWPVTVSYYDKAAREDSGEQTPEYAMSFELYENGVSRALKLDFNDFVIAGAMSKFDVKTAKPCK